MKAHRSYQDQLTRMVEHGLICDDVPATMAALKKIGYYRLSAYTYPFRKPATDEDRARKRQRSDDFRPGAHFQDAMKLYEFDRKIRAVTLQALQDIEVGLATKIGYVLGKRAGEAHLQVEHLNPEACLRVDSAGQTSHEKWLERYYKLKDGAKSEEYVKHHILNHEGKIPIWVATGFMDFGCLTMLYSLMDKSDQKKIASELGLRANGAETLQKWLKALNILRNHCAHNNRVWNRSSVSVPPKISFQVAPLALYHLNDLDNDRRQKLYFLLALTAHLVRAVDPESSWAKSALRTQARKLGNVAGMTLENTMGFPEGWQDLELWN